MGILDRTLALNILFSAAFLETRFRVGSAWGRRGDSATSHASVQDSNVDSRLFGTRDALSAVTPSREPPEESHGLAHGIADRIEWNTIEPIPFD